ncbi:response regulator [Desmospora activa]|uniref:Two-component system response regulator YesN n=1 Tax=Desmospora activa DSM 45169 TaxID=1121389 RepID=A0A2T4ZCA5_9BACL|nr:response regulator [Desmospora activa]PTM59513.1 two-component system response regulator YesN [Desmospora activa DSM 45169]
MFNVLIVDDEPVIQEGLKTIIPWSDYGFRIDDVAANGKEALQHYQRLSPDLMIVDIRMPVMDGVELIEAIRQQDPDTSILVLSGYADFAYAQQMIRFHVDGYLLKPIDDEEMVEYIAGIQTKLREKQQRRRQREEAKEWQWERLLQSAIVGGQVDSSIVSAIDPKVRGHRVLLVYVETDSEINPDLLAAVKADLRKRLERWKRATVFTSPIEPYVGVWLQGEVRDKDLSWIQAELESIARTYGCDLYAVLGGEVDRFQAIKQSYTLASAGLNQRFVLTKGIVMRAEKPALPVDEKTTDNKRRRDWDEWVQRLTYALQVSQIESVETVIREIVERMIQAHATERQIINDWVYILSQTLNNIYRVKPSLPHAQRYHVQLLDIHTQPDIAALEEYVRRLLNQFVQEVIGIDEETLPKRMLHLIHLHYADNLKLEKLAQALHYNSAYLGKLFKKHTGQLFNTYVDRVRIDKAKELLAKGKKVYEVAEEVGYRNVDYFHSKFKKYVKMSPSTYRKTVNANQS